MRSAPKTYIYKGGGKMIERINKNGRTYQIEATCLDCWNYKTAVYELVDDGSILFISKAITNNIMHAFNQLTTK